MTGWLATVLVLTALAETCAGSWKARLRHYGLANIQQLRFDLQQDKADWADASWLSELFDDQDKETKRQRVLRALSPLQLQREIFGHGFGLGAVGTLRSTRYYSLVNATETTGNLHHEDEEILRRFAAETDLECAALRTLCECARVGCIRSGTDASILRVASLEVATLTDVPLWTTLHALSALPSLTVLLLKVPEGSSNTCSEGEHQPPVIPQLRSLVIEGATTSMMLEWIAQHEALELLEVEVLHSSSASVPPLATWLAYLCKLRKLQWLALRPGVPPGPQGKFGRTDYERISAEMLPACLSQELRHLDVRGQALATFPPALANLPKLQTLIAFGQGQENCPIGEAEAEVALQRGCAPNFECSLSWNLHDKSDGEWDMDTCEWKCPVMRGSLDILLEMRWPALERLWLDANFLQGTVPTTLVDHFPHLRSFDLHDNVLTGEIPANFARRTWERLQLHENRLQGDVPPGLWDAVMGIFSIVGNAELTGTLPQKFVKMLRFNTIEGYRSTVPGTNVNFQPKSEQVGKS